MPCPDANTLERLLHGQLPAAETDRLARHLEECDRCVAVVQTRSVDDTLAAAARAPASAHSESEAEAVDALVERLSGLHATVTAVGGKRTNLRLAE